MTRNEYRTMANQCREILALSAAASRRTRSRKHNAYAARAMLRCAATCHDFRRKGDREAVARCLSRARIAHAILTR